MTMTLRLRLAMTVVTVTLLGLWVMGALSARQARTVIERTVLRRVHAYMGGPGRAECEASPSSWSAPTAGAEDTRRPFVDPVMRWAAYDSRLQPSSGAPPLEEDLRELQARNGGEAHLWRWSMDPPVVDSLLRMPWSEGPCANVFLRRRAPPTRFTFWGGVPPLQVGLPVLLVLGLTVLLGLGTPVRRIRQLALQVRVSGIKDFTLPTNLKGNDEISSLALAFADAAGTVRDQMSQRERHERVLREFLENVTHDVMTPLAALQGQLASIAESAGQGELPQRATVASALDEAEYLGAMFQNLAAMARLDSPEPAADRSPVDLNDVVLRVAARHRLTSRQREVVLEYAVDDKPLIVSADVTLLEQAVGNIVHNAIRYNKSGGHVAIIARPVAGGRFQVTVLDDGPGVSDEDLQKIVVRGFRGDAARSRSAPHGLGLGMSIVHRVVSLHGWDLKLGRSEFDGLQVTIEGAVASES